MVLPSGQELTLGLLATITLEVLPFRVYVPFPALPLKGGFTYEIHGALSQNVAKFITTVVRSSNLIYVQFNYQKLQVY
jgi:hypothetical protein